jgi:hypothetical protein
VAIIFTRHPQKENAVEKTEAPDTTQKATTQVESVKPEVNSAQTGGTNISTEDLNRIAAEQSKKLEKRMGVTPDMTPEQVKQKALDWYHSQAARLVPEQKPIEFHGRVVDENTNGIAGANIHFIWNTSSAENGTSTADTVSSTDGTFSLIGGTGSGVSVYVSKDGYYETKALNQIDYDPSGGSSSKDNPVLFHFRKKGQGADLVTSQYGVFRSLDFSTPQDGSPLRVDFFNRKTGSDGQMEVNQVKPAYGAWQTATGWSYRLAIPDGGFVETSEELPFQAPESGYQPVVEFNFQKGNSNWTERIDKTFYIAFGNPRRFGRIHVETSMTTGTILEYAINPDGSRNLESK